MGILDLGLYFDLDRDLEIREGFFLAGGVGEKSGNPIFCICIPITSLPVSKPTLAKRFGLRHLLSTCVVC